MDENKVEMDGIAGEETDTRTKVIAIVVAIVLIAALTGSIIFLLTSDKTPVIRDIFIILLGAELFLSGVLSVILIFQIARLVNMLQHEIQPVLDAANETMATIRGTAVFMSETLTQPVIKASGFVASIRQALNMLKNLTK